MKADAGESELAFLRDWETAMDCYKQRQFNKALDLFIKLKETYPDDGALALYVERCDEFTWNPPATDWDGVFSIKSK
jgi:hypothetical protein